MPKTTGKPGKRIRGKIAPFKPALDPLFIDATTNNGIEIFREHLKDAVALRMRHVAFKQIKITPECIKIIEKYFNNEYTFSFIKCSLDYYCDEKEHKIEKLDFSGASCTSRDDYKTVQHAKMDCLACNTHYVKKIKNNLLSKNDNHTEIMMQKCISIEISVKFVSSYIAAILVGELPKKLKANSYVQIEKNDESIRNLYSYDKTGGYYVLQTKNATYKSLRLDTATEIFCDNFTI